MAGINMDYEYKAGDCEIEDAIDAFRATKFEDAGYFLIAAHPKQIQISFHRTAENAEVAMADFAHARHTCWIMPPEIIQFLHDHPEVAAAANEAGIVLSVESVGL